MTIETKLTVDEAIAAILSEVRCLPVVRVPLDAALGQVLAEDVISDRDSPPFDKALMDGYAVRSADVAQGSATLRVIDEITAGQVPRVPIVPGAAARIMTGAPVSEGADAVVAVEQTRLHDEDSGTVFVQIESTPVAAGRNILKQGASTRRGTRVLAEGRQIRAQEIGALAELGKDYVAVYARPRVAVLSTGDELVPAGCTPGPGQIRNSNEVMLSAQLRQMGAVPVPLGVARDDRRELREAIGRGLACDMLLLSGGVSAGKLDLVPEVLSELGVRQVFHKVRVKPGQPVWFGMLDLRTADRDCENGRSRTDDLPKRPCCVFGLPGNPVSSMVCCELFARTAVRRMMGIEPAAPRGLRARLSRDHFNSGNRPTYHPARWELTDSGAVVEPVKWVGSADLSATVEANAMVLFPEGGRTFSAGTTLDVYVW
jgi:molybdopterin molybdotransferase